MIDALLNMVIGMGTVFAVLVLISLLIASLNIIPYIQNKLEAKKQAKSAMNNGTSDNGTANNEPIYESYDVSDDTQLVAVITAAIMAYGNASNSDFVVRSIKRR
ncbi:MAG: OadG family protein [Lachnospiraceae bacterium]|nr:OadG family protein [Lachnospiraceae bacterium]MBR4795147.1 OadG family protein [Lachnospiraceae bacterium]